MKTKIEYEASDIVIDKDMDPAQQFFMAQIVLVMLTGAKAQDGDDPQDPLKRLIALSLNLAQNMEISITKAELPGVFKP